MISRNQSRQHLIPFIQHTNPEYEAAAFHIRIAQGLEAIERGDIDRLAIFVAARHGKSELASRRFPAWYIGRNPAKQIICASYNAELASDFGRQVRNTVASQEFGLIFPEVSLAADSSAADRWHTTQGGVYIATGVGGTLTGRGAHVAIIDDPHKDRKEADSETQRNDVWNWYRSVLYTRLMPKGAIVLVLTRWHEDDLAGRILASKDAHRWTVMTMPALSEGRALWPERYPVEVLARIREVIGEREFSALFQQQPQPDEGTFFKRQDFKLYNPLLPPANLHVYLSSDFAATEGAGDYTEIAANGIDEHGNLYLGLSWWYGQTTADQWIEVICDQIHEHKPLAFFGEAGVIRRMAEPVLTRRMHERNTLCRLEWITRIHDKATMARALQARAAAGKVYVADNAAGHRFIAQALSFPAARHDDAVDCAAIMALALDQITPALRGGKELDYFQSDWG